MTSLVQQIGRLAIRTFRRDSPQPSEVVFNNQCEQLYNLVNRITPDDINLDSRLLADSGQNFNAGRDGAPVTYMQVYEDHDVTICVFILKRGVRLPLHDHPGMFGMLKVLHGSVSVQSYSHLSEDTIDTSLQEILNDQAIAGFFPATKHQKITVTAKDSACRLSPSKENMHEIQSVDGPAAFLDILSPPYGTDRRLGIERDCHYYQEIENLDVNFLPSSNFTLLISTPSPADFWCDQAEYSGAVVNRSLEDDSS